MKNIIKKHPRLEVMPKEILSASDEEIRKKIFDYVWEAETNLSRAYRNWLLNSKWDGRIRVYWDKSKPNRG